MLIYIQQRMKNYAPNENHGNVYHPKVRKNSKRSSFFIKDDKEQVTMQEISKPLNIKDSTRER